MWFYSLRDIKQKPTNKPNNNETTHRYRQQKGGYRREREWARRHRIKEIKFMVTNADYSLDGEHIIEYTGVI